MSNIPYVSIIVPFYNIDGYLGKCIDSITAQTYEDFEVILIDDGSTDNCGNIAKRVCENDRRFKYYFLDRGGVAAARNFGLERACGEYIAFVDGDDCVCPEYLQRLVETAKQHDADIVCCDFKRYFEKSGNFRTYLLRKQRPGEYTPEKMIKLLLNDYTVRSYLWNKLWRKRLFTEGKITFPQMYFEDIATLPRLVYYANKVVAIPDRLYIYTIRKNSIMTSFYIHKLNDYALAMGTVVNFLSLRGLYKKYRINIFVLTFYIFLVNLYSVLHIHIVERSPRGFFSNWRNALVTLFHFALARFTPSKGMPKVPRYIMEPSYYKERHIAKKAMKAAAKPAGKERRFSKKKKDSALK